MNGGVSVDVNLPVKESEYVCFFFVGTDSDLEYYVRECGDILGISGKLAADKRNAKHILEYVLHQVVEFKKLNQVSITFYFRVSVTLLCV